jgi:hypothetical protein
MLSAIITFGAALCRLLFGGLRGLEMLGFLRKRVFIPGFETLVYAT